MNNKFSQLIIFGATGDLASLKLFPSIFELFRQNLLPENFQMIGYGRSELSQEQFKENVKKSILAKEPNVLVKIEDLLNKTFYFTGNYDQIESYEKLNKYCQEISGNLDLPIDQIAYFSVPPNVFEPLAGNLALSLKKTANSLKIVIEKPFGVDTDSASHLFALINNHFEEEQVYLLDHYLGKRPIQSILKLRLENNAINLLIRPEEIACIQISALEVLDVGKRVSYYDQVGALKDMVQSHLLQILALIGMTIPLQPDVEGLAREKQNFLSALRFSGKEEDLALGQYKSYSTLPGVAEQTKTDTLAAFKVTVDRREWFGVPIYLRTGKLLNENSNKVVIEFKKLASQNSETESNKLVFEIKPLEEVKLSLVQETPTSTTGSSMENLVLSQSMACNKDFCLGDYASLLNDVLLGQRNFFLSFPEIVASWKLVDQIESLRMKLNLKPDLYEDSSGGTDRYLNLPSMNGFKWL